MTCLDSSAGIPTPVILGKGQICKGRCTPYIMLITSKMSCCPILQRDVSTFPYVVTGGHAGLGWICIPDNVKLSRLNTDSEITPNHKQYPMAWVEKISKFDLSHFMQPGWYKYTAFLAVSSIIWNDISAALCSWRAVRNLTNKSMTWLLHNITRTLHAAPCLLNHESGRDGQVKRVPSWIKQHVVLVCQRSRNLVTVHGHRSKLDVLSVAPKEPRRVWLTWNHSRWLTSWSHNMYLVLIEIAPFPLALGLEGQNQVSIIM